MKKTMVWLKKKSVMRTPIKALNSFLKGMSGCHSVKSGYYSTSVLSGIVP